MAKKNVKILIVDDHPILRDGIKTMLEMGDFEGHSFEVSEAGNGIEMSEQLTRKEFDIVIMDYKLEETDGPTLTKKALEDIHIFACLRSPTTEMWITQRICSKLVPKAMF